MRHIYNGDFSYNQIAQTKKILRGSIFFLLLCVDEKTKGDYPNIDIDQCFQNLLYRIGGLNTILDEQAELVITMSLLQSALAEYHNPDYDFRKYRKLILDAGAEIQKLQEGV